MRYSSTRLFLGLLFLIFASCTQTGLPEEGKYYRVSFGNDEGIAIFAGYQNRALAGKLYKDEGRLFSVPVPISVKGRRNGLEMVFPDGTKRPFNSSLYVCPIPDGDVTPYKPYTDSLYEVERVDSVRYAVANGYYASYPCPRSWGFAEIYGKKLTELNLIKRGFITDIVNWASFNMLFRDKKKDLDLALDLYLPKRNDDARRPLVVIVHGGAFFNGNKEQPEYVDWCTHFASLGYVAASINYRMGYGLDPQQVKEAGYMAVQDARAAIRYLLSRDDLLIDEDRVFIAGTSAGAITALNVAFMDDSERPEGMESLGKLDAIAPEYQKNIAIRGVGNMWGAVIDTAIIDRSERTDIISFHNKYDDMVPYGKDTPFEVLFLPLKIRTRLFGVMYGSEPVTESARQKGIRSELVSYDIENTPNHLSELHSIHFNTNGERNERFGEIRDKLVAFFSEAMELHPTLLEQQGQLFQLTDQSDIRDCIWHVEGGLVLEECGPYGIRVLMFQDAPAFSVETDGTYDSTGLTFHLEKTPVRQ